MIDLNAVQAGGWLSSAGATFLLICLAEFGEAAEPLREITRLMAHRKN